MTQDGGKLLYRLLRWLLRWVPTIQAQVLLKKLDQKRTWANVVIATIDDHSPHTEVHEARVDVSHRVMTQLRSGETADLRSVPQYRVRFTAQGKG